MCVILVFRFLAVSSAAVDIHPASSHPSNSLSETIGQANVGQGNGSLREGRFGAVESAVRLELPSSRFRSHSLARHSFALDVFAGVPSASYGYHVPSNAMDRYNRRVDDSRIAGSADGHDAVGNRTLKGMVD
jgi:hypothetical protein